MKLDNNKLAYIIDCDVNDKVTLHNTINNVITNIGIVDTDAYVYNVDNRFYLYFEKITNEDLKDIYNKHNNNSKLPNGCIELTFELELVNVNIILDKSEYTNVISYYPRINYTSVSMIVDDMLKLYNI